MKTTLIALTFLGATALAEVGQSELEEARELAKNGKLEEALQKHIWFHEESKKSPGMGGVRLSFALADWTALSQKYPKAKEALVEVRNKNEKALLNGEGDFANFHDLSAINKYLEEEDKTVEVFKAIDKQDATLAASCYRAAEDILAERGEYGICGKYFGDPIKKFEDIRHMRELNLSLTRTNAALNTPEMLTYSDNSFIKRTRQAIEILIGLGRRREAEEIHKRALSYFDHEQIRSALSDADQKVKTQ